MNSAEICGFVRNDDVTNPFSHMMVKPYKLISDHYLIMPDHFLGLNNLVIALRPNFLLKPTLAS